MKWYFVSTQSVRCRDEGMKRWRGGGDEAKRMTGDLVSKRKAKTPTRQYFGFEPNTNKEPAERQWAWWRESQPRLYTHTFSGRLLQQQVDQVKDPTPHSHLLVDVSANHCMTERLIISALTRLRSRHSKSCYTHLIDSISYKNGHISHHQARQRKALQQISAVVKFNLFKNIGHYRGFS